MQIEFDPAKNERNIRERGLSFERAVEFDFKTAARFDDVRRDYGEKRLLAIGYLDARLHVLCFTEIVGGIRVISFRKANRREVRKYAEIKALDR
jgi:uncharacterized protein